MTILQIIENQELFCMCSMFKYSIDILFIVKTIERKTNVFSFLTPYSMTVYVIDPLLDNLVKPTKQKCAFSISCCLILHHVSSACLHKCLKLLSSLSVCPA